MNTYLRRMRRGRIIHLPVKERIGITISHCADILDCSRAKIYSLIDAGKLQAFDLDGRWRVTGESIAALVGEEKTAD